MTTEQTHTVRAALEHAGKLLTDAAKAMEPEPDRPPMPAPANECWWCESEKRWITVEEKYGKRLADLPQLGGYTRTGEFAVPADGCWFHGVDGSAWQAHSGEKWVTPRLILRPIPPAPKRKRLVQVFPGEKMDSLRAHLIEGEWYQFVEES